MPEAALPIVGSDAWPAGVGGSWLFQSPSAGVTRWKCHDDGARRGLEKVQYYFVIAFVHAGSFEMSGPRGTTFVDLTRTIFFNPGESYCTRHPHGCGDSGTSLVLAPSLLREILCRHGLDDRRSEPLMPALGCMVSPRAHLLHRLLVARAEARHDAMAVEETAVRLAEELLVASRAERRAPSARARRTTPDLVEAVRGLLLQRFREEVKLDDLARAVDRSTFHVCRSFRRHTGVSVHRYLTRLRLRAALEETRWRADLTAIALDAGFSSHSHFSAAFRQEFGLTPSDARRMLGKATPLGAFEENA